jgi:hypothetical protein
MASSPRPAMSAPAKSRPALLAFLLCLGSGLGPPVAAISGRTLALPQPDGTELNVQVMAAEGERLTIWLPSVFGRPEALWALLERLPDEGIEVWLTDPIADRFLPQVNSSYEHAPPPIW